MDYKAAKVPFILASYQKANVSCSNEQVKLA